MSKQNNRNRSAEEEIKIKIGRPIKPARAPAQLIETPASKAALTSENLINRAWQLSRHIASTLAERLIPSVASFNGLDEQKEAQTLEQLPEKQPLIDMQHTLVVITLGLLFIVAAINIPFGFNRIALARSATGSPSVIIQEGLLFKSGSGAEVYFLSDQLKKHLVIDRAAFELYEFDWQDVNIVDEAFMAQFPDGEPLYALTACVQSPHVYALEDGKKRWIEDFQKYEAHHSKESRFVWDSCADIARIPLGDPLQNGGGE